MLEVVFKLFYAQIICKINENKSQLPDFLFLKFNKSKKSVTYIYQLMEFLHAQPHFRVVSLLKIGRGYIEPWLLVKNQ